ncbi:MAG: TonB-dependent receptor [Acidobacteriota bacterium]
MSRRILLLLLGFAIVAGPLLAQGNPTGKLTGRVTADGSALPGVTVTVTSPNLQGSRTTVTTETGSYIFAVLPPGTYQAVFSLDGMQPQTAEILVAAAQTKRFDTEMSISEVTETIIVTGNSETFAASGSADTTFHSSMIEQLAVGRDLDSTVLLTPGVQNNGPGANQDRNTITIAGAQSFENLFMINGVVVNENLRGQSLDLFIEDAIQETTTSTSSISAEFGRFTGGVVNAITRSGGNEISGSLRVNLENEDWEEPTPVTVAQEDSIKDTFEATLGGYILKDRLWFFTAGRTFDRDSAEQTFVTNVPYTRGQSEDRVEGKLTLALNQSHSLLGSIIDIDSQTTNNDPFGIVLETQALTDRADPQTLTAFNYTGVATPNLFLEAQYSEREFVIAEGAGSRATDFIGGTTLIDIQNSAATYHTPYFCGTCPDEERNNESALVKASYFASTEKAGSHDIVIGYDSFSDLTSSENHQSPTGFQIWTDTTIQREGAAELFPVITPGVAWVQWWPIFNPTEGADFTTNSIFLNDNWQLNDRWSFNLGVRYDENDGTNSGGAAVADDSNLSPRLGATYDVRGDGDLIVNASYGQYVAALNFGVADSTSVAGAPADFEWDYQGPAINADPNAPTSSLIGQDEAIRLVFDWFDSVGGTSNTELLFFANVPGANTIIRDSLSSPTADELTVGVTKKLGTRGLFRADYVRREYGDFYFERRDLTTGQTVTEELGAFDLGLIVNDDSILERAYDGLHTQFSYRLSDRLNLAGNWTWSHARGNFEGETRDSGPLSSDVGEYPEYKAFDAHQPRGSLAIDARHKVRLWAVYDVLQGERQSLSVSLLQSFTSGTPYGAEGAVNSRDFIANPGYLTPPREVDYWFTGRDAFTTDDITSTDLAVNYAFKWNLGGKSFELFLQPEVLNVFDEQNALVVNTTVLDATNSAEFETFNPFTETPIQGVHWDFGRNFGQPVRDTDYQRPRTFRLSAGFRF